MRLDASGNLGLGVTPSAWTAGGKNIEVGSAGNIIQGQAVQIAVIQNATFNSGWKYSANGNASFALQTSGQHQWFTAPSGTAGNAITFTQAMTLDASGRLGIGTTSPTVRLDVTGDGRFSGVLNIQGSLLGQTTADNGPLFRVVSGASTSTRSGIAIKDSWNGVTNTGSYVYLFVGTGSGEREAMRIINNGNIGIGTTTPDVRLQIDGTNNQERLRLRNTDSVSYLSFSEQNITMWRPNDSGSAFVLQTQPISGTWTGGGGGIEFRPLNTLRMTIGPTGNIGAPSGTNIYNASDARLKQNISQITYGLDAIAALNPVKFNWIDGFEPSEDGKDMLGFVAQEVLEVIPEAIELFGGDINLNGQLIETPLRVNEKFIIPVLVKAIQELSAKITILENK
jgi:hypothetical protein